jgi:hypothetical protein
MSARIAPDTIGLVAAMAVDYRPPAPASSGREVSPAASNTAVSTQPRSEGAARPERSEPGQTSASTPSPAAAEKAPPPPPPPEQPGADYVRAVISGELAPRPTTAQELFVRVGTSWTPPESEYRLTEKIA